MTREIKIDGTDQAGKIPLTAFRLVTSANAGEVGIGSATLEDKPGTLVVPAWKSFNVTETAEGAAFERIFTGYTGVRDFEQMGPYPERRITTSTIDLNHRLEERIIRAQVAIRPAETDVARVTWLAASSYLSFLTTVIIQTAGAVNMDATDCRDGTALDVLNDCAEASGRDFFLHYNPTDLWTLWYAKTAFVPSGGTLPPSGNTFTSTYRVSDDPSDQAGGLTYYPIDPKRSLDPSKVYSGVNVGFDKGSVFSDAPATETAFKLREIAIDSPARTSDGAESVGANFLDQADGDEETVSFTLLMPVAVCNRIPAGYRVQVKLRTFDVPSFTWYRVTQTTTRPAEGENDAAHDMVYVDFELRPRNTTHKPVRVRSRKPRLDDETVPNGGFENGPHDVDNRINDWNVVAGTAQACTTASPATISNPKPHGGRRALRIAQAASAAEVWTEDFAPVGALRKYILRAYFMYNAAAAGATFGANPPQIQVYWYNSNQVQIGNPAVSIWLQGSLKNLWNRKAVVVQAPNNSAYRKIRIYHPVGTAGRYSFFDDVTFDRTDLALGDSVPAD